MAVAAHSLLLGPRACAQAVCIQAARPRANFVARALSTTPARWASKKVDHEHGFTGSYSDPTLILKELMRDMKLSPEERRTALAEWNKLPQEQLKRLKQELLKWQDPGGDEAKELRELNKDLKEETTPLYKVIKPPRNAFWGEDEMDPDLITPEKGEDDFEENDITSMGHGKLDEIRDHRQYARLAVWDMPMLTRESWLGTLNGQDKQMN
jgi:small subunit ribosomal protein S35